MDAAHETDAKMDEDMRIDAASLKALRALVTTLEADLSAIHAPELAFFKDFLERLDAKLPEPPRREEPEEGVGEPEEEEMSEEEEVSEENEELEEPDEEEPEEEDAGRMSEDKEPFPEAGPAEALELTDEQLDAQNAFKQAAHEAMDEGRPEEAVEKLTEAIKLGGASAMVFARRAEALLSLKRPLACIVDCTAAVGVNPDSGKAYRIRGKAHRALGHWEDAHRDLDVGQMLDYDDETEAMHRFVDEKWGRISAKQTRKRVREENAARKQRQREIKRRRKAVKEAKEKARAYQEAKLKEFCAANEPSSTQPAGESGPSTSGPKVEEVPEEE